MNPVNECLPWQIAIEHPVYGVVGISRLLNESIQWIDLRSIGFSPHKYGTACMPKHPVVTRITFSREMQMRVSNRVVVRWFPNDCSVGFE